MSLSVRVCAPAIVLALLVWSAISSPVQAEGRLALQIQRGQKLFERTWQPGHDSEAGGDGLGPLFNERSCVACHFQGGVGGAGPAKNNITLLTAPIPENVIEFEDIRNQLPRLHPAFSNGTTIILHQFSVNSRAYTPFRERLLGLGPQQQSASERPAVIVRSVLRKKDDSPVGTMEIEESKLLVSERNTPPLFGMGLIAGIPRAEMEQVAQQQPSESPTVAGRFVGPFGWRGQTNALGSFVRGACAIELGLRVDTADQALDPLPEDPNQRPNQRLDLSKTQCDDLTVFVSHLPPPRRLKPSNPQDAAVVNKGEHLFAEIGCAVCHRPTLGRVKGIYSDLLVHDMGASLADPIEAPESPGPGGAYYFPPPAKPDLASEVTPKRLREWKTPPLWGLRDSGPYLHDGRAETVEQAITLHGGEADFSAKGYLALPGHVRTQLLTFLATLAAPDPVDGSLPSGEKKDSQAAKPQQRELKGGFAAAQR